MATLQTALARFGFVTVMDAYFYPGTATTFPLDGNGIPLVGGALNALFKLDTLRISNFTQEGPRKTAKGGLDAEVVFRYGKTARLEMEDVVGRIAALEALMGVKEVLGVGTSDSRIVETFSATVGQPEFYLTYPVKAGELIFTNVFVTVNGVPQSTLYAIDADRRVITTTDTFTDGDTVDISYIYLATNVDAYQVTERFDGMYKIFGRTFVVDQESGEREYINIIIHKFLPDGLFNVTMESEGDFGVISLAGELFTNECGVFYEFTKGDNPAAC